MALEKNLDCITMIAGVDLSAKQYRFVALASDGQIDPVGTAGANADGVLQNDPDAAGKPATVAICGVSKVEAGDAITIGGQVSSDNQGRAIPATSTHRVLGRCLETVTAAGQITSVLLKLEGEPNV